MGHGLVQNPEILTEHSHDPFASWNKVGFTEPGISSYLGNPGLVSDWPSTRSSLIRQNEVSARKGAQADVDTQY